MTAVWQVAVKNLSLQSIFCRRALRIALAMFLGTLIYRYSDLIQGLWVILTISIVMQGTTGATLRKGLQRFLGTLIGILIGSIIFKYTHNPYALNCLLVVFIFVAYYLKSFTVVNYGIFVVPISIMVVFLVSSLAPEEAHLLILARIYDTCIGASIGIVVSLLVLPNRLSTQIEALLQKIEKGLREKQYAALLHDFHQLESLLPDFKYERHAAKKAYLQQAAALSLQYYHLLAQQHLDQSALRASENTLLDQQQLKTLYHQEKDLERKAWLAGYILNGLVE